MRMGFFLLSTLDGRVFLHVYIIEKLHHPSCFSPTSVSFIHIPQCDVSLHSHLRKLIKHWKGLAMNKYFCSLTNIWCFVDLYDFGQIKISSYNGHLRSVKREDREQRGVKRWVKDKRQQPNVTLWKQEKQNNWPSKNNPLPTLPPSFSFPLYRCLFMFYTIIPSL